ncbi:hypothetical protein PseudUWO311_19210 [Pseudanabaena sp. UWO311]|uniref:hypothetical protein n=1 Tax=Pseudanabaena sp. UWO311 TaxID=2487337 RepID=UPI00115A4E77|nr:hypothetical protein [Pseudanabaena sp. UWO311]TYQ24434.1 hypothetical protein PseudUWO311_19210 [Pseudanabaena sp. UWO311]
MLHKYQEKIISLWIVFLLGLLFHTQLGLMPLFHGLNIVVSQSQNMTEIAPIMWLMLSFFVLPMAAIVGTVLTDTRPYRIMHFWFTLLYTLLNLSHLIADLMVKPIAWYQIALMAILLVIGLLINIASYQWMQDRKRQHSLPIHT